MGNILKIAIHPRVGSFSTRWIEYCKINKIQYQMVDCFASDIMGQLKSFDILLWHWIQDDILAAAFAYKIIKAAEHLGLLVFPDTSTCWHFDDKIAQKYLLEAVCAPLVPSHVFYAKDKANAWITQADFPNVFKLKGGAGSSNVHLVADKAQAIKLCRRAFGSGFISNPGYFGDVSTKFRRVNTIAEIAAKLKRLPRAFVNATITRHRAPRERCYLYFQDFLPSNLYDTRVTVIGNRAFGFTRDVRHNDFRASGSGSLNYDLRRIDLDTIKIAFNVAETIKSQSMAFDFVKDVEGRPKIIEMSYGYQPQAVHDCAGHWDRDLNWHEGHTWPEYAILDDLLRPYKQEA